jgi:hypothetical protein
MKCSGNKVTPPSIAYAKKILGVMLEMCTENMKKRIAAAKARYNGIAFVGLSADTWSSRRTQGFIAVEISFVSLNSVGKGCMAVMCLGCKYFKGSHTKEAIAEVLREVLAKFGLDSDDVIMYVSDSGGGIPAAAKVLRLSRIACMLHLLDTIVGRALGLKGVGSGPRARPHGEGAPLLKAYLERATSQASVWKNSNLKLEQLEEAHEEAEDEREAFEVLFGNENVRKKSLTKLQQPNNTRMWSHEAFIRSTWRLQKTLNKWFSKFAKGADVEKQLPYQDRLLTPYVLSLLKVIREAQQAVEAATYPTASFYFAIIHDLKEYFDREMFLIYMEPDDEHAIPCKLTDMPAPAQYLVRNVRTELEHYFQTVHREVGLAAYFDPRVKGHPALDCIRGELRGVAETRFVKVLAPMLKDDPGYKIESGDKGEVEHAAAKPRYRSTIDASFGVDVAATCPPIERRGSRAAAVAEPKSSHTKAVELAEVTFQRFEEMPVVDQVLYGKGSGDFSLLAFYDGLNLGLGKEVDAAFKIVATSSFGTRASAAGPETIFSLAGRMCTALRNSLSVWCIELLVFLSKNKEYLPSDDEVVAEILRRDKLPKARKTSPQAAEDPCPGDMSDGNDDDEDMYYRQATVFDVRDESVPEESNDTSGGGEGEDDEDDLEPASNALVNHDPRPLVLTDSEVSDLYSDVTEARLDCIEGPNDDFEEFMWELSQKDLFDDLDALGV